MKAWLRWYEFNSYWKSVLKKPFDNPFCPDCPVEIKKTYFVDPKTGKEYRFIGQACDHKTSAEVGVELVPLEFINLEPIANFWDIDEEIS